MKNIITLIKEEVNNIYITEYEKLGKGATGKVFEKDGYAYKITPNHNEIKITKFIMDNWDKLSVFPKIEWIKISPNKKYFIVKRELLKTVKPTEKAKIDNGGYQVRRYLNKKYSNKIEEDKDLEHIENRFGFSDEFIDFIKRARVDFKTINIPNYIDFHGGNVGRNQNGEYILFDY